MKTEISVVNKSDFMEKVLIELSEKRIGAVCVVENNEMIGQITEGDVRRSLSSKEKFFDFKAEDIMAKKFLFISKDRQAIDALER